MTRPDATAVRVCAVDGCTKPRQKREWCGTHYERQRRYGYLGAARVRPLNNLDHLRQISSVETDECIVWDRGCFNTGYPAVTQHGKNRGGHRIVCEWFHGPNPDDYEAAHSCIEQRDCVNPRHLRWAPQIENLADRILQGTLARGHRSGGARLTADDVRAIRTEHANGGSRQAIAKRYGIRDGSVSDIVTRRCWAWLD